MSLSCCPRLAQKYGRGFFIVSRLLLFFLASSSPCSRSDIGVTASGLKMQRYSYISLFLPSVLRSRVRSIGQTQQLGNHGSVAAAKRITLRRDLGQRSGSLGTSPSNGFSGATIMPSLDLVRGGEMAPLRYKTSLFSAEFGMRG